jgi:hypothetical protein
VTLLQRFHHQLSYARQHAHLPLPHLYRIHFKDRRRERHFWASLSFAVTFGLIRLITHLIHNNVGPFHNVSAGGVHIHHLVWGILLLLVVGYIWLSEVGASAESAPWLTGVTAALFGVAAALTLDEFALWLNLQDVYWEREGRQSIQAIMIFAGILSIGVWGGPFLHAVAHRLAFLSGLWRPRHDQPAS